MPSAGSIPAAGHATALLAVGLQWSCCTSGAVSVCVCTVGQLPCVENLVAHPGGEA